MKLISSWDMLGPDTLGPALDTKLQAAVEAGASVADAQLAIFDVLLRGVLQLQPTLLEGMHTKMLALDFGYRRIMEFGKILSPF